MLTDRPSERATASALLMVRPAAFAANVETAQSNEFQRPPTGSAPYTAALAEFDAFAQQLSRAGAAVLLLADSERPAKPDAIFPNNWFSTHADGSLVLYPMMASNRRPERREAELEACLHAGGFRISEVIDLSHREAEGKFLEGTGSLVLDRPRRLAYACLSPRTDLEVLGEFSQRLGYELLAFTARGPGGGAVYHTNVLMAIGETIAIICAEAIGSPAQRRDVLASLGRSGREVLEISIAQMCRFAGNALFFRGRDGSQVALSAQAWQSLAPAQQTALRRHAQVIEGRIPTIETYGGGSVRCMLAEVFLPKNS